MNAGTIINDQMTLEEKLNAIDRAMKNAQDIAEEKAKKLGIPFVPIDPADATICVGCQ